MRQNKPLQKIWSASECCINWWPLEEHCSIRVPSTNWDTEFRQVLFTTEIQQSIKAPRIGHSQKARNNKKKKKWKPQTRRRTQAFTPKISLKHIQTKYINYIDTHANIAKKKKHTEKRNSFSHTQTYLRTQHNTTHSCKWIWTFSLTLHMHIINVSFIH